MAWAQPFCCTGLYRVVVLLLRFDVVSVLESFMNIRLKTMRPCRQRQGALRRSCIAGRVQEAVKGVCLRLLHCCCCCAGATASVGVCRCVLACPRHCCMQETHPSQREHIAFVRRCCCA